MDGMRIVVVEDQPLFRRGLIDLLGSEGFRVEGSAGTVREAIEVVEARMPDIVLMDLQLTDGSGIDATRRLYELYGERVRVGSGAGLIAEITGRPLAFLAITEEQLRAGLTRAGLPVEVVNTVISIQASFAAGAFDIVTGDVERLGGRPLRPLREVLAAALKFPSA